MTAALIDGRHLASTIREGVQQRVAELVADGGRPPSLAVILVGDNPASQIYVSHKDKACRAAGITSSTHILAANISQAQLLDKISELNRNDDIDGVLLQLPLPAHLDKVEAIMQIDPKKDVDGLTAVNQGRMFWRLPALCPCTPLGIMELIKSTKIELSGKVAAIVGRSLLVGMPIGFLLELAGCTIIGLHSESIDCARYTSQADIVVVATGAHHLVGKDWIKPGAVVIDVGIHRVGNILQGDVKFDEVRAVASHITPVPGGVGPMTIAMLVKNCLQAYEIRMKVSS